MALLGVQLVITLIVASFLQKLSPHFSLARWILCSRLVRYLHPSSEDLRQLAGLQNSGPHKGKNKNHRDRKTNGQIKSDEPFKVPRSIDIQLESVKVSHTDVVQLHFYPEYQWLVDFSVCAVIVYLLTEVYFYLLPGKYEFNLSMLWCLLVIAIALKALYLVTALYFKGDESSGERSMCITCGFLFFVVAMIVLVVDEELLEFGLNKAYTSFNESIASYLKSQGVNSRNPASLMGFRFILALWCGVVGAFFTFPGLRFAKMHYDSLKYCAESPFWKLVFNFSFMAPFLLMLLWIKPIARDYFVIRKWPGMTMPIMTADSFETSRLIAVIGVVLLRFFLMPSYLQSYLNMAHERIDEMKRELGQISNVEIQKKVARVFYYLCVVALQYVSPLLVCCFFTFLLKTLGGYSWFSYFNNVCYESDVQPKLASVTSAQFSETDSILAASQHFSLAFANVRKVFTPVLYRGILNFLTWWLCSVWFTTSTIGLIYHSYFASH